MRILIVFHIKNSYVLRDFNVRFQTTQRTHDQDFLTERAPYESIKTPTKVFFFCCKKLKGSPLATLYALQFKN